MISTDNIVRGFALCPAFVFAGLLVCLLLPLKLCYGIMCVIKMRVFLAAGVLRQSLEDILHE